MTSYAILRPPNDLNSIPLIQIHSSHLKFSQLSPKNTLKNSCQDKLGDQGEAHSSSNFFLFLLS